MCGKGDVEEGALGLRSGEVSMRSNVFWFLGLLAVGVEGFGT